MINYITSQSFKCLLGKYSKNVQIHDNIFTWEVGKKKHFAVEGELNEGNISFLNEYAPSNFYYINLENLEILKKNFIISRSREKSVVVDIRDLNFTGAANKKIRHCLNRAGKENFIQEKDFRKLKDVEDLIEEWSNLYTDKYFRDNSGKNMHFYRNGFHKGLISSFLYKEDMLVSFGTLSSPINGYSSYVLGKSLYKRFYGLSEYADVELYKIGKEAGIEYVNMGGGEKRLLQYKMKFPHRIEDHYYGTIERKEK